MKIDIITKTMMHDEIERAIRREGDTINSRLNWVENRLDKIEENLKLQIKIIQKLK